MPVYLKVKTPAEGWRRIVRKIMECGIERIDERGSKTKWLDNVLIHVIDPYSDRVAEKYPFSEKILREKYATQILSPDRLGFDYTYGERLKSWGNGEIDQIEYVIRKLKENKNSRRAVATTWDPRRDTKHDEVPCLNHFVFMMHNGKLDLSIMIRSNDMYGAWLANLYAVGELLANVATKIETAPGSITTLSVNAHIYEHDWEAAGEI